MKTLALLIILAGTANADIGRITEPASSSGGFTDGQDVTGDDGVFKTLQSTGTAPSLTATGAVFTASVTVNSVTDTPIAVYYGGNSYIKTQSGGTGANAAIHYYDGTNNAYAGLFGANCAAGVWSVFNTGCWLNVTPSGLVGIGTASPSETLHVVGDTLVKGGTVTFWNHGGVDAQLRLKGYESTGGASEDSGEMRIGGGVTTSYGARIGFNGVAGANTVITNMPDNAVTGVIINVLGSGTPIRAMKFDGDGLSYPYSRTIAQLLAITPNAVGGFAFCSNCSPAKIVVSTGTAAGNFADAIGGAFQ